MRAETLAAPLEGAVEEVEARCASSELVPPDCKRLALRVAS